MLLGTQDTILLLRYLEWEASESDGGQILEVMCLAYWEKPDKEKLEIPTVGPGL